MGDGEAALSRRKGCRVPHGQRTLAPPSVAPDAPAAPPRFGQRLLSRLPCLLVGVILLVGATGFVAFDVASVLQSRTVRGYGAGRAHVVAYISGNLADGYVLLAGDSHVELARPEPVSCGRRILNAGVSGAKASDYSAFLDMLTLRSRPAVAVVTLGTNHLKRKVTLTRREVADRYEAELTGVVERLSRLADRVVVAAVPPASTSLDRYLDRAGIAALTRRQARVCARLGCTTVDPYASYRGAAFDIARPGATEDGLHLTDYAAAYRAIDRLLCS